ncbi:MAG: hypothetical protein ACJ8G1_06180 [Vitreoscilla sp.]
MRKIKICLSLRQAFGSGIAVRRDTPPRNPSEASMRQAPNRSRTATAAVRTALRGLRAARFLATRNPAHPFPIPL